MPTQNDLDRIQEAKNREGSEDRLLGAARQKGFRNGQARSFVTLLIFTLIGIGIGLGCLFLYSWIISTGGMPCLIC